jgi:tetratricopeptide (TPR) repeat protein
VRHLAFFRSASTQLEGSAEYQTLLAGVLVLRLLDKRRSRIGWDRELRFQESAAVARAVGAIPESRFRPILNDLVDTISACGAVTMSSCVPKLIVYGQCLEKEVWWDPAADVYLTALELMTCDRALAPMCCQRAGVSLKNLGLVDRAADLFREGLAAAIANADQRWALKSRISLALLDFYKGDLSATERQLDRIIAEADAGGLTTTAAEARHERGMVAYARDQCELAAEYYLAAMPAYVDPDLKMRLSHDLALALQDMGDLAYARNLLSNLRDALTENREMRDLATLNLLRIAVQASEREQFDRLRRELANARLTGRQRAHYHLFLSEGYFKFGEATKAGEAFAEGLAVARAHRINVVHFEMDLRERVPIG